MNTLTALIASLVLSTTIFAFCVRQGLASQMPSAELAETDAALTASVDDGRTPDPPVARIELGE